MKNNYSEKESRFLRKLGNNIRKYREQSELSQEKFAFKAGLDRTYISGIERGERNISVLSLMKIANALNIEIIKLIN